MTGQPAMTLVLVLAVLCGAGIVGMLLVEAGAWDGVLFVVAALPLLVGGWLYRSHRDAT